MIVSQVKIVLFPNIESSTTGDITKLCPANIQIPEGFTLSGGSRKFIILKDEDDEEMVLAIGPLIGGNFYYHKAILAASKSKFGHLEISGGGNVDFSTYLEKGEVKWSAKFSGSSGDFGVFDPSILAEPIRKRVQELIGMSVRFDWSQ